MSDETRIVDSAAVAALLRVRLVAREAIRRRRRSWRAVAVHATFDQLVTIFGEPRRALVAVDVDPVFEGPGLLVERLGAVAPVAQRAFGVLALAATDHARQRSELVEPVSVLADALVGFVLVLAHPGELVCSSCRLEPVV